MMRSPPPPLSQQSQQQAQTSNYGNPYQSPPAGGQQGGGGGGGGFGPNFSFMNDPTAAMGLQVGQHAMKAGQDYMEQNVCVYQVDEIQLPRHEQGPSKTAGQTRC